MLFHFDGLGIEATKCSDSTNGDEAMQLKEHMTHLSPVGSSDVLHLGKLRALCACLAVAWVLALVAAGSPVMAQKDAQKGLSEKEEVSAAVFIETLDKIRVEFDRKVARARAAHAAGDCDSYRKLKGELALAAATLQQNAIKYLGDKAKPGNESKPSTLAQPEWVREQRIVDSLPHDCTAKAQKPVQSPLSEPKNTVGQPAKPESIVPELETGVIDGYRLVTRPDLDEHIHLIADAAKACDTERYMRYRKELQDGFDKERSDLVKAGVENPDADPRIAKIAAVLRKYPPELVCEEETTKK